MITELAHFALALTLALCLVQAFLAWKGRHDLSCLWAAERAGLAAFLACFLSLCCFIYGFLTSDFSVFNIAQNSHIDKPLLYKLAGSWASHEGSMLLWCAVMTGAGAGFALGEQRISSQIKAWTLSFSGLLSAGFLAYVLFVSNPFLRLDPPALEGAGLNPLLQHPLVALHPPLLYVGYVGLSLPYALALAVLICGDFTQATARVMRRWVLLAWSFLTLGIIIGSLWAYRELGWGGWWFWDPVENASLMPWLLTSALLHAVSASEKRGVFKQWTIFLALSAFSLSVLGTFLTRSGILTSVHAFALSPERGAVILSLLTLIAGGALALFAWRAPRPGFEGPGYSLISREGMFMLNNLVLTAMTGGVLVGTLYPLLMTAFSGRSLSVGAPYFNVAVAPLAGLAFMFLPFATRLGWRRGHFRRAIMSLRFIFVVLAVFTGLCLLLIRDLPFGALAGLSFGVWVLLGAGVDALTALKRPLLSGVWARVLAHAGLGLLVTGAVAEACFPLETVRTLSPGEGFNFAGRHFVLEYVERHDGANYAADRAEIRVEHKGRAWTLKPERRLYWASGVTTMEAAIRTRPAADLYISLGEARLKENGQTGWAVSIYINRLIWMVFSGAFLMALAGFLACLSLIGQRIPSGKEGEKA